MKQGKEPCNYLGGSFQAEETETVKALRPNQGW